jgi:hypothetical protein
LFRFGKKPAAPVKLPAAFVDIQDAPAVARVEPW